MSDGSPPRNTLYDALAAEQPLRIVGAINAYCALLAQRTGFRALYLSGAGVSNASRGLPDLGMVTLEDVLVDARRICGACRLPLLVDADTGLGEVTDGNGKPDKAGQFENIGHTVRALVGAGAAGMHVEDQIAAKRCGHRPGKVLVSAAEMSDRVKAAVDARASTDFVIMARTDAASVEGLQAAIDRGCRYVEAGADMVFAEALTSLDEYRRFTAAVPAPVLANLTEFGRTPLFTVDEMASVGVRMVLYPLSAFRAMSAAAEKVYETLRREGAQRNLLPLMQTREELYDVLDYHARERQVDERFSEETTGTTLP